MTVTDRSLLLVASRLAALGHPPDYLARDALEALVRGAAGSEQRLRAGLAGALFLAETEDAPQVDRLHVQRALDDAPPAPVSPPPASRPFWMSPWAAIPLYVAAALLFLLPRHGLRVSPPVAVQRQAASTAAPPAAVLQEEVPPAVSIVIGRRTRQAAAELQALVVLLRQAGMQPWILPAAPSSDPRDTAIAYFYAEDRRLADRVARLLDANPNPQRPAPAWPRLVAGQAGTPVPPGSIEIRLP